ncbi:MAG: T9SS type A sorting domain-containing protein [Bacteroidetes bacterium]|nr:MAG: T9SS type A sorting domain-containing protein [Bacteroidota bacterium]
MKKLLVTLLLFVILSITNVFSQVNPDNTQKMYYLCKVWGFLKYFHSEVAKGTKNWDSVLIKTIPFAENAVSEAEFTSVLLNMISKAGPMAVPTTPPPEIEDSLKINLDLSWFNDVILSAEVKAELDTVMSRFREHDNYYIKPYPGAGNPLLTTDTAFTGLPRYPNKEIRLDALFRYWNIINYFYPYKYQMDRNWDSTLTRMIPVFINATGELEYDLAILELATYINDSHAFVIGNGLRIWDGTNYPPFTISFIENETVITKLHDNSTTARIGDIIRKIDGVEIQVFRDSLRKYTIGSNEAAINRNINSSLLAGEYGFARMTVENTDSTRDVNFTRNDAPYIDSTQIWRIIENTNIGYVDMGRLIPDSVASMFKDLWNTRAIIFDIRNYPQNTIFTIIDYLTATPIEFVKFTSPYISYPGVLTAFKITLGGETPQPELYKGDITILFNEEAQSHSEYTCMIFDYFDKTYKIGSQTAGADGNVSFMYLPGIITAYFTGLGVFYPDGRETQRVGIIPDMEVKPTINGIREGRDEVLDAAIKRITDVGDENEVKVRSLQINPNPACENSTIKYYLEKNTYVQLELCNSIGNIVSEIVSNEFQNEGVHQLSLNTANIYSGMYYLILRTNSGTEIYKILVIK